ncbi:RNase P subunit p30-domain-containing protein [Geopyxis carbonaria]|nr:RNase P subunit p30-domain-containing protein [Geopyxis carbonaria]
MFYDLHVPCPAGGSVEINRTVAFLGELGYNTVVLSHTLTGKLPGQVVNPLPSTIPGVPHVRILRRCTLIIDDPSQNHRLAALTAAYDIVALRPTTEKLLLQACTALDCDLISLDFSQRLPYFLKHKLVGTALQRGLCFEVGYSGTLGAGAAAARANLIQNTQALIRATRNGRGIVISSEARSVVGCRAPHDVINMAVQWGLSTEKAMDAVSGLARTVVVQAGMRRTSFKGVVDVVADGVTEEEKAEKKRKAEEALKGGGKKQKQTQGQGQGKGQVKGGQNAGPGGVQKMSKKERKAAAAAARSGP